METEQALAIRKAVLTLADAFGTTPNDIAGRLYLLDSQALDKLKQVDDICHQFYSADIVERGAMLGLTITPLNDKESAKLKAEFEEDL